MTATIDREEVPLSQSSSTPARSRARFALILLLVTAAVFAGAAPAAAQVVETPPDNDVPWGQNVSGFMAVSLGLLYLPQFDMTAAGVSDDFGYDAHNAALGFPAFSAFLSLIPAFGNNGIAAELGYEMLAFNWKQDVTGDTGDLSGESTLALSNVSFSVNYLRYFLSGMDRLYLLVGGGYIYEKASLSTETGDDGATSDTSFPNWRVNTGIGYLHQTNAGAIGTELRVDMPLLRSQFEFDDPNGAFETEMTHPVILRLCVTLMVGRLRSRP